MKRVEARLRRFLKWLVPGMMVKRYVFLVAAFVFVFSAGVLLLFRKEQLPRIVEQLPRWYGLVFVVAGVAGVSYAVRRLNRSILSAVAPTKVDRAVDVLYAKRYLARRPRIVCVGGGTGLHNLLRGLKEFTTNLTAVVTVADDGGSSGRLRKELGMIPPGDIRNCLVALAEAEPALEALVDYRFSEGELEGHSLGNLLIAAMTRITGRFDLAIRELSEVLAVRGKVLPSALEPVVLSARLSDGRIIRGESAIPEAHGKVMEVSVEPRVSANPEAVVAIEQANAVVLGPGSLFTSIIPNLLVQGIPEAIRRSKARTILMCNIMTQPGETDGYAAEDHLRAVLQYVPQVSYVLINRWVPEAVRAKYAVEDQEPVAYREAEVARLGATPVVRDLLDPESEFARHDPDAVRQAIQEILEL